MSEFSRLPEVFVSKSCIKATVSRHKQLGWIRKLGSRLYTRNLDEDPEKLVLKHLWQIVDAFLPGALIADRTAIEKQPAVDGSVFLITNHSRDIRLPGVTLRPRKGIGALATDLPFVGSLRVSSPARAWLENMRPSRARSGIARTMSRSEIEAQFEIMVHEGGKSALQHLQVEALKIAATLEMLSQFELLDSVITGFMGRPVVHLTKSSIKPGLRQPARQL
jgi:hypothetical protein